MASKYAADAQIADSDRKVQLQKASYDREVNTERAKAALASELQQVGGRAVLSVFLLQASCVGLAPSCGD